jgi:predicted ATP-dependent serine protease
MRSFLAQDTSRPNDALAATGITGLDAVLEGGFPRTNVILVQGVTGTGKTVLGVEGRESGAEFRDSQISRYKQRELLGDSDLRPTRGKVAQSSLSVAHRHARRGFEQEELDLVL